MKVEVGVPEAVTLSNEIQEKPKRLFEMIRVDIRETVGQYLTVIMALELTHSLGRDRHERIDGDPNHRNSS